MFNFREHNSTINLLISIGVLLTTHIAIADDASEWQYAAEIYLWGTDISGTIPTGNNFEIPFDDVVNNLDMALLGRVGARKDKLTLFTDIIHLELSTDEKGSFNLLGVGPTVEGKLDIGLKSWILQPTAAYTVFETEKYSIDLLAGARYLWMEVDLGLRVTGSLASKKIGTTESEHNWDGIVGVRGKMALTDKWDAIAYADGGTGDSDYTVQGIAGFNYKFDRWEGRFGYRYMKWEMDNKGLGRLVEDLTIDGPYAGALFKF